MSENEKWSKRFDEGITTDIPMADHANELHRRPDEINKQTEAPAAFPRQNQSRKQRSQRSQQTQSPVQQPAQPPVQQPVQPPVQQYPIYQQPPQPIQPGVVVPAGAPEKKQINVNLILLLIIGILLIVIGVIAVLFLQQRSNQAQELITVTENSSDNADDLMIQENDAEVEDVEEPAIGQAEITKASEEVAPVDEGGFAVAVDTEETTISEQTKAARSTTTSIRTTTTARTTRTARTTTTRRTMATTPAPTTPTTTPTTTYAKATTTTTTPKNATTTPIPATTKRSASNTAQVTLRDKYTLYRNDYDKNYVELNFQDMYISGTITKVEFDVYFPATDEVYNGGGGTFSMHFGDKWWYGEYEDQVESDSSGSPEFQFTASIDVPASYEGNTQDINSICILGYWWGATDTVEISNITFTYQP